MQSKVGKAIELKRKYTFSHRSGPGSYPDLVMWNFVMDKSGAGAGFLRQLRFPLPIYIPSASPQSSSLSQYARSGRSVNSLTNQMKNTWHWRKLYNEKYRNLHYSSDIMMKSIRTRWAGHAGRMGRKYMHTGLWWKARRKEITRKT
jgi:hypothetical protein